MTSPITNDTPTIGPNGELQRLSVSTLKKGKECLRRFFINKKLHVPEPTFKAQQVGTEGHAQLEHFVKTGEDVLGPIARAGKHLLRDRRDALAEFEAAWSLDGVPVTGFIDLLTFEGRVDSVRVTDFKFLGNLKDSRFNAQEPKDLVDVHDAKGCGVQMVGYAVAVAERWPRIENIELEHIQIGTKKREARSILAAITPDAARERWEELTPLVRSMKDAAKADRWEDVPATWTACARCPFRDSHCFATLTPQPEKNMGILSRLGVQTAASSLAPPPAATGALPTSTPAPTPAVASPTPAPESAASTMSARIAEDTAWQAKQAATPAPAAPIVEAFTPAGQPTTLEAALSKAPIDDEPVTAAERAAIAEAKAEEKPKRTRKKDVEALLGTDNREPRPELPPEPTPLCVYVDCVPNTATLDLDVYIAELVATIAKKFNVDDIRWVTDKNNPIAYAGWKGALAAAVKVAPPAPGDYFVRSDSEFAQIVIEAIKPLTTAGNFVRGVR
jgi:hypothetical protein